MDGGSGSAKKHQWINQVVFFFHPVRAWEQGVVVGIDEDESSGPLVTVRCKSGEMFETRTDAESFFLPTTTTKSIENIPDDLLELPELHDALLLHVLKSRHAKDLTYMHIGEIILSVNPYKAIQSYMDKCMGLYLEHLDKPQIPSSLPPHVWSVAHRAYVEMRLHQRNYSIIASGESGSGKTEACKNMLRYLCAVSERVAPDTVVKRRMQCITEQVEMSNVVLESFGNAKTLKNDNSSRFGKFMEVQFDASGVMVGLRVTPFLLERSRAVTCGTNERVYHVFYQLVAGANPELRAALKIENARDFVLLGKGGYISSSNGGSDDAKEFLLLQKALVSIGFSNEEQKVVWNIVASILHLQNISFELRGIDESAYLRYEDVEIATFVATHLLELPQPKMFVDCLTTSIVVVGGEKLIRTLSVQKAKDQRDSICKYLYSKLFLFIVCKVNAVSTYGATFGTTDVSFTSTEYETPMKDSKPVTWIALLDIFGFEDFQMNSLEQFCINLANEALQRQYTERVFLMDIEEMRAEGVEPNKTDFIDNYLCLELLQGSKNSIVSFLDDASVLEVERSRTNPDYVFLNTITSAFRPDYQTSPGKSTRSVLNRKEKIEAPSSYFYRGRLDDNSFTIRHFAGDVKYCVNGFVEKNNDFVKDSSAQTLQGTNSAVLRDIMRISEEVVGLIGDPGSPGSPTIISRGSKRTVASTFRNSLRLLMETLNSSTCNWVRCIRPHSRRQPGLFDGKLVLEQLVATGVLSTIKQRQDNFPVRPTCNEFMHHYHVLFQLNPSIRVRMTNKEKIIALLLREKINTKSFQVGNSRVFLTPEASRELESKRQQCMVLHARVIEQYVTAFISRLYRRILLLTRYAIKMQRVFRTNMCIRRCINQYYDELRRKRYERFLAELKKILRVESFSRAELYEERDLYIRNEWRDFRIGLAPLVAGVLQNLISIERKKREEIVLSSFSYYSEFTETFDREKVLALELEKQRIRLKQEMDVRERVKLLQDAIDAFQVVISEEKIAFETLWSEVINPGIRKLKAQARVICKLNHLKEKRLQELYEARESEKRRIALVEAEELHREEKRWRSLVGEEQYLKEIRYFNSFYENSYDTPPPLLALLREGVPSEVMQTPIGTNPLAPSSLGSVMSFRDYREYMRNEFSRASASGKVHTSYICPHNYETPCQLCNFSTLSLYSGTTVRPSKPSLEPTVCRRLYEENTDSDDSFDEMNY
ncbi:myosin heavy chain [Trypanosoma theileri]|uniref:Myosin heavy chain n=1 Tax=Trypanosoma theileri TaxID=67003 RepID=A0A1X0NQ39_9TRYP|nr:myosin heavy chain [Trypanosoma theileri]ORC86814.1 myosin heavy chain [Trypanosoma theileri]